MKKKCLIIIPGIPYPPVNGYKLKIYNLIKILFKHYDLHLIIISREVPNAIERKFLEDHSYKYAYFRIELISALLRVFISIFSSIPFQVAYFTLPTVRRYIKRNANSDEIVFLNLIRSGEYIDLFRKKNVVFDMVDLLSKSYVKSYHSTKSLMYKVIYKIEAKRLKIYELKVVKESLLTLCVNNDDANYLSAFGKSIWLPNGVNDSLFIYNKLSSKYKHSIAFFGAMHYQPNIDAVIWFDHYVMNHIDSNIIFYIIGAKPSKQILNILKHRDNVIVTGFMEDPYLILNSCFAVIAPMQNGGGIQNKILETMSLGKINILTSHGADPIKGAVNDVDFIVRNTPLEMAIKINDIFKHPSKYKAMGGNASRFIKENYTWERYEENLLIALNRF
ncbi:glycosyltransferase [Arcticibacter eurypsychrophilus]|uniref:glycosyltransferase n=1 Tax=Arcticibacter eurypsychrophilus TaxID=1434752 RepID=UPI00084D323B|nr:glycosyltransferase [Arcticibacter eurypsychrophilus]